MKRFALLALLLISCREEHPAGDPARFMGPLRVGSSGVDAPVVIHRVDPPPPASGRERAVLQAIVSVDGNVRDVIVLKATSAAWGRQCAAAVRQWKFLPGQFHGRPVEILYDLSLPANPVQSDVPRSGVR